DRTASIIYDREGSSFARTGAGDFDWDALLDGVDLVNVSGITPALGEGPAAGTLAAAKAARSKGVQVSFDGNYRAQLWQRRGDDPAAVLAEIVAETGILFGNHRDIALLLGRDFAGDGEERRRSAALAAF